MGASGDLAKKKTFPALFGLFRNRFLPKGIKIIGYARTKMDHEEYLKRVKSNIKTPTKDMEEQLNEFCKLCTYVAGQYDKDESFQELEKHLQELEKGQKETNRVFYMALPPSVFIPVSQHLKRNNYPKHGIARVIVRRNGQTPSRLLTVFRLRNRLAKTFRVRENYNTHWSRIGKRRRYSVLTTTLGRKWSRTFSCCVLATVSFMTYAQALLVLKY